MHQLVQILIDPVTILAILFVGSFLSLLTRKVVRNIFIVLLTIWFFLVAVSPLPQWLVRTLESTHPVIDPQVISANDSTFIMILGGGHSISPGLPTTGQLSNIALGRLVEAIRVKRSIGYGKILCSGFSRSGRVSHAEMLSLSALALGIESMDTLMLTTPRNTREEAQTFSSRFGKRTQLIIVTDAVHMGRAIRYFLKEGLTPIAAPTNHYIKIDPDNSPFDFIPSVTKIEMMRRATYEYAALLAVGL